MTQRDSDVRNSHFTSLHWPITPRNEIARCNQIFIDPLRVNGHLMYQKKFGGEIPRQYFNGPYYWKNVTIKDRVDTLVLLQDLPHCEIGLLRKIEIFEDDNQVIGNPQFDQPAPPALATVQMQNGEEHISGFSDNYGMFSGLKLVPPRVAARLCYIDRKD